MACVGVITYVVKNLTDVLKGFVCGEYIQPLLDIYSEDGHRFIGDTGCLKQLMTLIGDDEVKGTRSYIRTTEVEKLTSFLKEHNYKP